MYQPFDSFLFRTPYFPFSALPDFGTEQYEPVFREMLQIATPDLSEGMEKGEDRAQYSAYRYFQRACTRPTPFGLFAGCSVGTIGERTDIQLTEQKNYKRATRLDMNYICALIQQIERKKNIREQLRYYPNSSIYHVRDHLRYVECLYLARHRAHRITQVEISEYLIRVLSIAVDGALFSELASTLVDDEISIDVATDFIHELIDIQVLVSELEPAVTYVRPLNILIDKLKNLPNTDQQIIAILTEIETHLNTIDSQSIGITLTVYPEIIKNIEKTKVSAEIKYLFQTDMFKPVNHATLSQDIMKDIKQALTFLNKINSYSMRPTLSQFKDKFFKRYEELEMPLLFVLDNELGIGYAGKGSGDISPLVDDLVIPNRQSSFDVSHPSIQSILSQRYQKSFQETIELSDEDVKGVEASWDDFPPSFSVMCEILQDDEQGRSVYIKSVSGSSAANFLGRFCHLDKQILNHTLVITEKEAHLNSEVIFAEIVHLPESRLGNILLRPVLRPYEIPYLARPGVSGEFVLSPDDLYVSVKNNRIVLRSKRLNKEIVPRMSTAHNYSGPNSMPVYQFLCDLQHQNGRIGLWFNWNDSLDYLPRVTYKNCILSQARWTVRAKEIKNLTGIKDDNELLQKVNEWKEVRNIPDRVLLADGDNELFVDMNSPLSIRAWLFVVKKRPVFRLEEFLFDPATAIINSIEGTFINEFIFAFYREPTVKKK